MAADTLYPALSSKWNAMYTVRTYVFPVICQPQLAE